MAQGGREALDEYSKYVDVENVKPRESARIASDLSRFDTREEVRRAVEADENEVGRRSGREEIPVSRGHVSFGTISIFILFAAVASLLISCYVRQNTMLVEISDLKSRYANELSRNSDLQAQYEQRYVLSEIDAYATETLGMVKYESSQVEYIEIETPETITRHDDAEEGTGAGIASSILEKIKDILEFLT